LRSKDSFSQALIEEIGGQLDGAAKDYLNRIRRGCKRMSQLIDDLLKLSRVSRGDFDRRELSLSELAEEVVAELRRAEPDREVEVVIAPGLVSEGDRRLMRIALDNLIGNAWKFTSKAKKARIEFGVRDRDGHPVYFLWDNGAGFDMAYVHKLFAPFQRLHRTEEFEGTGIGLVTVARIIHRHRGEVWMEAEPGQGATAYFTLWQAQDKK
jgi:light-regulated signal transduction histidine kinase (bacteriophytochrome)